MTYDLYISRKAEKFLNSCDSDLRDVFERAFTILVENPLPIKEYDIRKIKGQEKVFRIRIGSYRIIYGVYKRDQEILILKVDKRGTVYRNL